MSAASENLRNNQEQADMDGCMVKVSRQAVDEALAEYEEMIAALMNVQKLISEAAMTGLNYKDGDWPDRLFASQQVTSAALEKATGSYNGNRQ